MLAPVFTPSLPGPQSQNPRRSAATPAVLLTQPSQIWHKSGREEALLGDKGLREYAAKRKFGKTPEPEPGLSQEGRRLVFVVHKHAARALHYDLRLELEGVLKSWAVPRGPSLDPSVKRLAVM